MQRTYWIRHNTVHGVAFDKIVCRDKDERPRWHKVEALVEWKSKHRGYGYLRINSVLTKREMIEQGYGEYL